MFFIIIAIFTGIIILSILIAVFNIKNIFIIFVFLSIFEIPIITVGFLKVYNIIVLDFIKLKLKSDNTSYRKQIHKKKNRTCDKYLIPIVFDYDLKNLEKIINDIHTFLPFQNIELKIMQNKIYMIIDVREDFEIDYNKLFDYLNLNKNIKFISNEDVGNYTTYIQSLKFSDKKYKKQQNINLMKQKLNKIKKVEEKNIKFDYLTNKIIENKNNIFIKIYKFLLYKQPLNLNIFDELKNICNITIHINNIYYKNIEKNKSGFINILKLNYINTFLHLETKNIDEEKGQLIEQILEKYNIIYKQINEENVKQSILLLIENRY